MKSLFSSALLAVVVSVQVTIVSAQITIGPDKLPVAGDRFVTTPMDTTGVVEGTAGGNKVWNFAGLTSAGLPTTIWYVPASSTPYAQNFPSATLASFVSDLNDTAYGYFSTAANKLTAYGNASSEFLTQTVDPEIQIATPLIYNDQFTDQFRSVTRGDGFEIHTSGLTSVINDSYGTTTLPGGVTAPAARLKFVRQSSDTTFVGGIPMFTSSMTTTSYEWFIAASKFPVVQIAYYVHVANGITTASKHVEYNAPQPTGVDPKKGEGVASDFRLEQNYPNPFNPTTNISFSLPKAGQVTLKVYNLIGQEVVELVNEELPNGVYAVPFDAKSLSSGTYVYRLSTPHFSMSKKMTLMK